MGKGSRSGGKSAGKGSGHGKGGSKSTPMTKSAASRIQSHSARSGRNASFARRAQSAADKRAAK